MNAKKTQADEIKHVFHIEDDGNVVPRTLTRGSAVAEIPPGVYTLVYEEPTPMSGAKIYLRPEAEFKLPTRLYGDAAINEMVDRFMRSYELNDKNLGILLTGEKGSGKTMMLKVLSVKAVELGFPVILVNQQLPGAVLNWFMSAITQNTLVNFDEFEKSYGPGDEDENDEAQRSILQLLDGTNTGSKKMFCFTVNGRNKVSQYLLGRPSRIRYVLPFDRMDVATVVDYVSSNLKDCNEEHLRAFIHVALVDANSSNGMNFDSMAEFVKEMNQFGGDLNKTLKIMGESGQTSWAYYDVVGFENGEKKYRALASAEHQGAYVQRDEMEITFSIQIEIPEGERKDGGSPLRFRSITLGNEHFKGFGDSYETLLFEHDGIEYHLRYTRDNETQKISKQIQEFNKPGKTTGVR